MHARSSVLAFVAFCVATHAAAQEGAVFTATNDENRNEVAMYQRAANGRLRPLGRFATGGRGQGGINDPLQSQNSVVLTDDHSRLLVVNAGSSTISVFRVTPDALLLTSVTPSNGGNPVSLAIHDDLVYVVNFGGNYHLAGFRLQAWGGLVPIANSRRPLSNLNPGASTVAFSPDGSKLVVSERTANKVDVFTVEGNGALSNPVYNNSAGVEPFGLTFTPTGTLLVSETNGGPPNAGSVSSYTVNGDNTLTTISGKTDAAGGATCWVITDGRFAFLSDTSSNNIGAVTVGADGTLTNSRSVAQGVGAGLPLDSALSYGNKFFYVLYSAEGKMAGYRVGDDGGLTALNVVNVDRPAMGNQGMAAY